MPCGRNNRDEAVGIDLFGIKEHDERHDEVERQLRGKDTGDHPLEGMEQQGFRLGSIETRANLHEAMQALRTDGVDALVVLKGRIKPAVDGVITRQALEDQYF